MKVKDILAQFEGIDPESFVTIHSMIECHRSTSICDKATLRVDIEDGEVQVYVDGEETDWE
jgi:hypothetical protein